MSTNKTPNYQLNQWVKTDQVLMEEFNADNSKVDSALNTLSGQVATKASQSALNSLTTTVNSKASQSALNSLTTTVNSKASQSSLDTLSGKVTTLTSQVAKLGNCQIDYFTYTGKATTNTTVTFPRKPLFFIIMDGKYRAMGGYQFPQVQIALTDNTVISKATWSGNQVSFSASRDDYQMNSSGATYRVVALSAMD